MSLNIAINANAAHAITIALGGRLDSNTAPSLDEALNRVLPNVSIKRLVFDLGALEYLSSAGIRCFIRARKTIETRGGTVALINPQPPVSKVLDIVKAIPSTGIFRDVKEFDAYLDEMQRKVRDGD